ncbi:HutD/Ves family protein [Calidifontibacter terrae]
MSEPIRWSDVEPTPWRNGGGVTREIAASPPDTTDFDWRVSIADVDRPGQFSEFAGIDRVITLLEGEEMVLTSPTGEKRLEPLQPYVFGGEEPIDCTLPSGPTRDFNVMTRRGRCAATVRVHPAGPVDLPAADRLLVALGSVRVGEWQLERYDSLPVEGAVTVDGPFLEVALTTTD